MTTARTLLQPHKDSVQYGPPVYGPCIVEPRNSWDMTQTELIVSTMQPDGWTPTEEEKVKRDFIWSSPPAIPHSLNLNRPWDARYKHWKVSSLSSGSHNRCQALDSVHDQPKDVDLDLTPLRWDPRFRLLLAVVASDFHCLFFFCFVLWGLMREGVWISRPDRSLLWCEVEEREIWAVDDLSRRREHGNKGTGWDR